MKHRHKKGEFAKINQIKLKKNQDIGDIILLLLFIYYMPGID